MLKTDTKVVPGKIEVVTDAAQWDVLMAGTEKQTPKQTVLAAFDKLEPQQFIICPVAEGRTQEQYVQDVSVFLNKHDFPASKKQVRKHPTDATLIVVRRLA